MDNPFDVPAPYPEVHDQAFRCAKDRLYHCSPAWTTTTGIQST